MKAGKQLVSAEISKVINIRDNLEAGPVLLYCMDQGNE
jgi:hypothetical protein